MEKMELHLMEVFGESDVRRIDDVIYQVGPKKIFVKSNTSKHVSLFGILLKYIFFSISKVQKCTRYRLIDENQDR